VKILPGYEVAYLTHKGPYTNLEEACNAVFGWIFYKGCQPTDAPREVYVKCEEGMAQEEWETKIQIPIGR
jgi:effector-binding domain-containing protein